MRGAVNARSSSSSLFSLSRRGRLIAAFLFAAPTVDARGFAAAAAAVVAPRGYGYGYEHEDGGGGGGGGGGEVDLGTTVVAIKYEGGVVVGADTRTSISSYVSNRYANKIVPLSPAGGGSAATTATMVLGRSGSAADTQRLAYLVRCEMGRRRYRYGCYYRDDDDGSGMSVPSVARWLSTVLHGSGSSTNGNGNENGHPMSASLLVAGYDASLRQGRVFAVAPSGAAWEEAAYAATGSGSAWALGFLDERLGNKNINNGGGGAALVDEREATDLCRRAVELAIQRDGSSGGVPKLCVCDASGVRDVSVPRRSRTPAALLDPSGSDPGGTSSPSSRPGGSGPTKLVGFAMPSRTS
jgi:20S proteasome subunit beta 1